MSLDSMSPHLQRTEGLAPAIPACTAALPQSTPSMEGDYLPRPPAPVQGPLAWLYERSADDTSAPACTFASGFRPDTAIAQDDQPDLDGPADMPDTPDPAGPADFQATLDAYFDRPAPGSWARHATRPPALFTSQYRQGDLVFGLKEHQMMYISSLLDDASEALDVPPQAIAEHVFRHRPTIGPFNQPLKTASFKDTPPAPHSADAAVASYLAKLAEHPKYAPARALQASGQALQKEDSAWAGDASLPADDDDHTAYLRKSLALRRSCKFALENALQDGPAVHYALDGIDMAAVTSRETFRIGSRQDREGIPVTTSELRFIFRNWGRLRDCEKLTFYEDGLAARAPWAYADLAGWAGYAMHLIRKTAHGASAAQIDQASSLLEDGEYKKVIDLFHGLSQPSLGA